MKLTLKDNCLLCFLKERKFVGGSMQLSSKMAARLGDRVKLNHQVVSVEQSSDGIMVTCANGQMFKV